MLVNGQLKIAQLEHFTIATLPAAADYAYRFVFVTDAGTVGEIQVSNGVTWVNPGGTGGGSNTTTITIEQLLQKLENEKSGVFTEDLDQTVGFSCVIPQFVDSVSGRLLKDTSSTATKLEIAWNPTFLSDVDADLDSTASWTAVNAGTNIGTSAVHQIGALSLSFDKDNSAAHAGIQFDRGSQNLSLSANNKMFFYINLPSLTNLTNVYARIYADILGNYSEFDVTTQSDGSPFIVGWNLISIDVSGTPTSSVGTGWNTSTLSRYTEVGVITSPNTQTYAGILIDSLMFSLSLPNQIVSPVANEGTLYDSNNKEIFIIDSANTTSDGRLTLKAGQSLANSYVGGTLSISAANFERQSTITENEVTGFNSLLSGVVSLSQEIRLQSIFREAVSGQGTIVTDITTPNLFVVTSVGASTIDVYDPGDTHLELLNGDTFDIFRPVYQNGQTRYIHRTAQAITADSTFAGSTTTLTLTVTGIQANDIVVKRSIASSISMVVEGANESFSALTLDVSPNGVQIPSDYTNYPNPSNIVANWALGSFTIVEALRNKRGVKPSLTLNGAPTTTDEFLFGRKSFSNGNGVDNLTLSLADSVDLRGIASPAQGSFWFYALSSAILTDRDLFANYGSPGGGYGWLFSILAASPTQITFYTLNNGITGTINATYRTGGWNHVYFKTVSGGPTYIYLNGVQSAITTGAIVDNNNILIIGSNYPASPTPMGADIRMADLVMWTGTTELTSQQLNNIYNNGNYRPFELGGVRYKYTQNTLAGQKMSIKNTLSRHVTSSEPAILKTGAIII